MGMYKHYLMQQQSQGWSSVGDKFVCSKCFEDYAIKKFIKTHAEATNCDYCGNTSKAPVAASLDEVLGFIADGLHREYEDPCNGVSYDSYEGGYLLPVTDTGDLFCELGFGNGPQKLFDDLVRAFSDSQWVQADPYGDLPCDALRYSWEQFSEQVKHRTRFVFYRLNTRRDWEHHSEPYTILESLSQIVTTLGLIATLPVASRIIRARQHSSSKVYNRAGQLGTAPKEFASQSRMSPAGIPMFYGALDEMTTFKEVFQMDTAKDTVTFGSFKTLKPLQLLDLSNLPKIPSMFDEKDYSRRMPLLFMHDFEADVTKPIIKDGLEHIEYVPTQIVAEHFRHVFKQSNGTPLDGILYRSSRAPTEICVALFCTKDECTDDITATGKKLALFSVSRKTINFATQTFV